MAKDERLYGRFTLDFPDHPKVIGLSVDAKWALVEMTLYSRRLMTDGFIASAVANARWGASVCLELASNDPEKPSLKEVENGYIIHDFEEHQTTKKEIESLREARKAAGQKGGKASAQARAKQTLKQKASKSKPETETKTYINNVDFDAFWKEYPRKDDKKKALEVFKRVTKSVDPKILIDAAKRYSQEKSGVEKKFIKLPTSWLNAGSWENEPESAPAGKTWDPWSQS